MIHSNLGEANRSKKAAGREDLLRDHDDSRASPRSILGYDTRAWRSAVVMRLVDALNPFRRPVPFRWASKCIVSSTAGLGDLFIHLPLISGIVNACRNRDTDVTVALRPAHAEIGRRCGWNVISFDNGLEDFFKGTRSFRPWKSLQTITALRQDRAELWVDLTGSAVSALAIKMAGTRRLAARITRGGKSLVSHPLPHQVQENEYANRREVAAVLGCELDLSLPQRICLAPAVEHPPYVVLCLTTACRWKNWPLANFRQLVERFPTTRFVAVGFGSEVSDEEMKDLDRIFVQPNVTNRMDQLSTVQLVDLIARAAAVVTNDTSAAHIANFFGKPGAVLFGPVSPKTFAAPDGLRVFHDMSCPLHPCVQWHCGNQAGWCMRKIAVDDVAAHLADVIGANFGLIPSFAEQVLHASNKSDWQRQAQSPV